MKVYTRLSNIRYGLGDDNDLKWKKALELAQQADKELEGLRSTIRSMISAAGLPDADEACRTVIEFGEAGLRQNGTI